MEVRYVEAAAEEVRAAIEYLQDRSPLAARRFVLELEALVGKLRIHPRFGYPVDEVLRKAPFRTLPWALVYRHDEAKRILWIVIVRHHLLRPSYGLRRRIPEQ